MLATGLTLLVIWVLRDDAEGNWPTFRAFTVSQQ